MYPILHTEPLTFGADPQIQMEQAVIQEQAKIKAGFGPFAYTVMTIAAGIAVGNLVIRLMK